MTMEFPSSKDHCHSIMSRIYTMLSEPTLCDMRITVEDSVFLAHRCVVVAACPNLFDTVMTEASQNSSNCNLHLVFQGLSAAGFRSLLTYIYTGKPPDINNNGMFADFIKACHALGIELPENKMKEELCEFDQQDLIVEISTSPSIEDGQHNEDSPVRNSEDRGKKQKIAESSPVAPSEDAEELAVDNSFDDDVDCAIEYDETESMLLITNKKKTSAPADNIDISSLFSVKDRTCEDQNGLDTFSLRNATEKHSLKNITKRRSGAGRPPLPYDHIFPRVPPYICPYESCSKEFESRNMLKKHYRNHDEKRHGCDLCHKKFLYNKDLIIHKRIHTGEKPYKCSECDASFTQKTTLKNHLVTHSKEESPEFSCQLCEKKYSSKRSLVFHVKEKHSGVILRYDCKGCGRRFKTRGALTSHMHKECDGSSFLCSKCGRKYKRKEPYEVHIEKCDGILEYKCERCDLTFKSKKNRYNHMVSFHMVHREKEDLVALAISAATEIDQESSQNVNPDEQSEDMEFEGLTFVIE